MFDTLGERKTRRRRRRLQLEVFLLCCVICCSCVGYLFSLDPEDSTDPMDIVQGTGSDMEGFEVVYYGPSELKVKWDELFGQAWSIAYITGWIQNASTSIISFESILYRVKDKEGNIIWESKDDRFLSGFTMEPIEYFDFNVMPICKRPAQTFELVVEGAEVLER